MMDIVNIKELGVLIQPKTVTSYNNVDQRHFCKGGEEGGENRKRGCPINIPRTASSL